MNNKWCNICEKVTILKDDHCSDCGGHAEKINKELPFMDMSEKEAIIVVGEWNRLELLQRERHERLRKLEKGIEDGTIQIIRINT